MRDDKDLLFSSFSRLELVMIDVKHSFGKSDRFMIGTTRTQVFAIQGTNSTGETCICTWSRVPEKRHDV